MSREIRSWDWEILTGITSVFQAFLLALSTEVVDGYIFILEQGHHSKCFHYLFISVVISWAHKKASFVLYKQRCKTLKLS